MGLIIYIYIYWLVISTILKNISQWEGLSHILWKIKTVPNHQPVNHEIHLKILDNYPPDVSNSSDHFQSLSLHLSRSPLDWSSDTAKGHRRRPKRHWWRSIWKVGRIWTSRWVIFRVFHPCHDQSLVITPKKNYGYFPFIARNTKGLDYLSSWLGMYLALDLPNEA